jgi:hypothetical protein
MHYLAEAIVFGFLACAVIGVMGYLMDRPALLAGIVGVAAVLFYITYQNLWSVENVNWAVGAGMMGLVVASLVYGLVFELIPFLWRLALRVGRFFDGLGRRP